MLSATKESHSPKNTLTRTTRSETKVEPLTSTAQLEHQPHGNDNAQDSERINKQKSSSSVRHDSPQEIAEGNCLVAKGEKCEGKINPPKKRFFDLKRTAESATNKISSISPSRFALNLTPKLRRKSAANHKLSQLERQSNLFIRDGSERKINNPEELSSCVSMESEAKHQQNSPEKCKNLSFGLNIPSANRHDDQNNFKMFCKNFSTDSKHKTFANYEEIDILNEDGDDANDVDGRRQNMITNAPDVPNDSGRSNCTRTESSSPTAIIHSTMENFEKFSTPEKKRPSDEQEEEFNSIESCGGAMSKPEYSSSLFKNIPVRARKGQVPHMDNYCLFDPSVDFCNDKDLRKKNFATQSTAAGFNFPPQNFRNFHNERQLVYDVSEHDEREKILAHHNYYEIDPELLEQDEMKFDHNRIESDATRKSSSSSSSCDYPSLFNSIIETTPSSTVTIESDESAYKVNNDDAPNLNIHASTAINQTNVDVIDGDGVITISSIVTATGAKKKSPQFHRIVKQMARNLPPSTDNANQQTTSTVKGESTRINLPFSSRTLSFDPLKSSHSLPQLQSISVRQERIADGDYNIEINNRTTIQLRRNVRRVRPSSSDSLDSGFTTPSPPNEAPSKQAQNAPSGDNNQVDNLNSDTKEPVKHESAVLTHCDNIQQLIEVSDDRDRITKLKTVPRWQNELN